MYVAAVIIAAGFVLFYCSYQIRLGAYVRCAATGPRDGSSR